MKKKIFIVVLFFLFAQNLFSQNIDSLKLLLTKLPEKEKASVLNQIAYIEADYDLDSALFYAKTALHLSEKYNSKIEIANSNRQIGRCYNFLGSYDSSLIYLEKALKLYNKENNKEGIAQTYRNIGRLYENKYDYKTSLENYFEAIKIFTEINSLNDLVGVYQDIGYVYIYSDKFELALEYYNEALKIFEKLGDKYSISVTYNNIGITYDSMKDTEKALEFYNKSIKLNNELGNDIVSAYIMHNIGIIYNDKGILDSAFYYFSKSLKITEDYEDPYGISYNLTRIATIYKKQGKLDSALIILDKSLEYTLLIDDKSAISENYLEYSNVYELKKDYFNAFNYYIKYDQLKDTVFDNEMHKQMNELETKYQTEKKDAENLLLKERGRKQDIFTYFLAVVIMLVIVIAIIFMRGKYKQIKINKLLELKNYEINQQKEEIQAQAEELEKINSELEKLSIVARETDNAVMIMDKNAYFEWVNDGYIRLYGYDLEETKRIEGDNLLAASSNTNIKKLLTDCIENKHSVIYESKIQTKTGDTLWAQTTITPIVDKSGNISKLIAIDSDISKLKKAEAEILQKNEEIKAQKEALEEQNEEIKAQRNDLERINNQIEQQNELIKGSIRYAKTIQNAILPPISEIEKKYSTSLIYRPKDIVSGDFYWYYTNEKYDFIVVADCTGHGVPGAFMSMIGSRLLNEVIVEAKEFEPNQILENLNLQLKKALKTESSDIHDGMELVLCRIEKKKDLYELTYSGAKRPLVYFSKNELNVLKSDRKPIGSSDRIKNPIPFTNQQVTLSKHDIIYLFTDGITDQNNKNRKKIGTQNFIEKINQFKNENMTTQQNLFSNLLNDWQQDEEQRDDITFLALQLK